MSDMKLKTVSKRRSWGDLCFCRLSTPAAFPAERKEFISVDHNHPYSSATVQLLDTRLYIRHKTIVLLAVLFCCLQYFPLAPVSLSTAKKIFLLMIVLYFIWLEYETCYSPCFILNSVLRLCLQKVPML